MFASLRGYSRSWLRADAVAGLTVWAVLVPEGLAYASIAGVPPVVGLYAAPAALVLYAALGSSRHLIVAPMSATAALSAGVLGGIATQNSGDFVALTTALAICVGVLALVAGIARLGFLSNFISEPVMKGFIVGLALTIIIGQVSDLLGVPSVSGEFFEKAWQLAGELGQISGNTLAVGAISLGGVLAFKRFAPRLPGSLVVVLAMIAASSIFDFGAHGIDVVGNIQSGLPPVGLPDINSSDLGDLMAGAAGVMLVGFAEGFGAARAYAAKNDYEVDANRELLGLGAANLGAGLTSGMVVTGSLSKTAVNGGAGGRSELSAIFAAIATIVTLLLFTGLFEQLPLATLAAVVIGAVVELVDFAAIRDLYRIYTKQLGAAYGITARPDFLAAVAAMSGVLVFGTLSGLFIGIGLSLLLLLYRASGPNIARLGKSASGQFVDVSRDRDAIKPAGLAVLRVEGGVFFANASAIEDAVRAAASEQGIDVVVLDAQTVPYIDVTGARMLDELANRLAAQNVTLILAHELGQMRDVMETSDTSPIRSAPTVGAAIEMAGRIRAGA